MSMSRSESHNRNRKRKQERLRRLLLTGGLLLAVIAVVIAAAALAGGGSSAPPDGKQSADAGSAGADDAGAGGEAGGDGAVPDNSGRGAGGDAAPGNANGEDPGQPGGTDGGTGSPAEPGTAGDGEEAEPGPVKLAFVGDLLLAASVDTLMREKGYDYPYAKALPYLQGADLTAGNLENPITGVHDPAEDKQFVFKGSPASLPALKAAGFDVVSLANNHTLDHGVQGLLETMDNLDRAGIPHMGGGRNEEEAFRPVVLEAKGLKIAYFGFSRVLPVGSWKAAPDRAGVAETYDERRAVRAIEEVREEADLVVVLVHWGREKADWPVEHQKNLARAYIDAGADLVVGAHPHVLQGFESYKGKWIAYSLGNFIFNMTPTVRTHETGVLDATCTREGECSLQLHPMRAVASQPVPLEGEEAKALLKRVSGLSIGASIDEEGRITAIADKGDRT